MTRSLRTADSRLDDESLLPAVLQAVRRCPARSDYIELCFDTDEGSWTWCLPEPPDGGECRCGSATFAMTVGRYGVQARCVEGTRLGFAVPSSEAVPMILGGSRMFVARKLVERGW